MHELFSNDLDHCPKCGEAVDISVRDSFDESELFSTPPAQGDESFDPDMGTVESEEFADDPGTGDVGSYDSSPESADISSAADSEFDSDPSLGTVQSDDPEAEFAVSSEKSSQDNQGENGSVSDASMESASDTHIEDEFAEHEANPAEQTLAAVDGEDLDSGDTHVPDEDEAPPSDAPVLRTIMDEELRAEHPDPPKLDDDDGLGTVIIDDEMRESMNATAGTMADFSAGSEDLSVDATFVEDDADGGDGTVVFDRDSSPSADESSQTLLSGDAGGDDLATLESRWGAVPSSEQPRMTIKSQGDVSMVGSNIAGDSISTVPIRTMRNIDAEGDDQGLDSPEYELVKVLGEGGMGIVWSARQTSVDRDVAVKMIKGPYAGKRSQRQKFLAEAVVTGDLDHPNIVPIYDVGSDDTGTLFYSMKKVKGTPWLDVIKERSQTENVEILLRVGDAMAFSHDRGIVHRDLKPENVMLGDFGEVLVMDWGLALAKGNLEKAKRLRQSTGMGGTPAYMAPEMATGPIDRITHLSDIYLLGAILWEVITGKPPHPGRKVQECLLAAMRNTIRPTKKTGELVDIALKAMETDTTKRYQTVKEFQDAIRSYVAHSESIAMATRATGELDQARASNEYADYSKAVFGFTEAYELWNGNTAAQDGIQTAKLAYAESAFEKGDYDLAASLLDQRRAEHGVLLGKIQESQKERDARQNRLAIARRLMMVMAIAIFTLVTGSFFWIRSERNIAIEAQGFAETQRDEANRQKGIAVKARDDLSDALDDVSEQKQIAESERDTAKEQRVIAQMERDEANRQKVIANNLREVADNQTKIAKNERDEAQRQTELAKKAKEAEEYEAYTARIGLAAAKIDENAFDVARELLSLCPQRMRNWEWGRLMYLCQQASVVLPSKGPVDAVAISPDGMKAVTGSWDHSARVWDLATEKLLFELPHVGLYVHSVAWSPDGKTIVTTCNDRDGKIRFWNAADGSPIVSVNGHTDAVVKAKFSQDGRWLVTCSYDETARIWDLSIAQDPKTIAVLDRHSWWVWDAAFHPQFDLSSESATNQLVSCGQDGKVIVWDLVSADASDPMEVTVQDLEVAESEMPFLAQKNVVFTEHDGPVYSVSYTSDGSSIASAGYDKRILVWDPTDVPTIELDDILSGSRPDVKYKELTGHTSPVQSLAFSNSGQLLVSGGRDNAVKLWSLDKSKALKTFRGHSSGVRSVVFSPNGKRILSAGQDQRTIVWTMDDYEEFRVLNGRQLAGHDDAILGARFSRDGKRVVTASRDRTAWVWDADSGDFLKKYREGHDYLTARAEFFPDGRTLVTAAADNTVRLWNVSTGTQTLRIDNTGRTAALALSHDGRWLVTGSDTNDVLLFDTEELKALARSDDENATPKSKRLSGHNGRVTDIVFSPTENWLLSCDTNGRCILRDIESDRILWNVKHHTRRVTAAAFSPDGKRVYTASNDRTVGCVDAVTGEELVGQILKHADSVTGLAISSDGQRAMTVSASSEEAKSGSSLHYWDLNSGEELAILQTPISVNDPQFAPNSYSAICVGMDNTVRPISFQNGTLNLGDAWFDFQKQGGLVWSARFINEGESILTVGGSEARLWDAGSHQEKMSFSPHGAVASADFSPDGKHIVTGSWDNSARIWNVNSGKAVLKLAAEHKGYVNSVVFSPDGKRILTASDDGTAKLWDAKTGAILNTLTGHTTRVRQAIFSPKGDRILTASNDRTAIIWNAKTGEKIGKPFIGHRWAVICVAFSPDGTKIATGSEDNTARLWDLNTGEEIGVYQGHTAAVTSVAFSQDGLRLLTASQDNTAKLWDASTGHEGTEILTLAGHDQDLTSVSVSSDGTRILTSSRDGKAIIWLTSDWTTPKPAQE